MVLAPFLRQVRNLIVVELIYGHSQVSRQLLAQVRDFS